MKRQTLGWCLSSFLLAACAQAPGGVAERSGYHVLAGPDVSASDQRFVQSAVAGNLSEMTLGRVALTHCMSAPCRAFARRMVEDHSRGLKAFQAAAHALGVPLTAEACTSLLPLAAQLGELKGEAFDRTYLKAMLEDHQQDLASFSREATSADHPQVKALAASTLPELEAHLALAKAASGFNVLTVPPARLSEDDQQFLMGTAAGDMAEIALGKIAAEHCQSAACKAFGQHMVKDHAENLAQLKALAKALDVVLPKEPSSEFTSLSGQLAKVKGKTFDELYLDAMVEDHHHDVAEFKDEREKADDPKVRAFAAKTLPVLEMHLRMAKDARQGL